MARLLFVLFALFIMIGMLLASGSALALLAKRGTYTSISAWQAVTKASKIDKDHTFISEDSLASMRP